ncbi:MAG: FprA family A-type flavoprotein [Candidatus Marinimicrobia bacterium]|nr:FprA family A-type flavoprotein [Candidatus Neomarinimicrobiota bacterium]
MAFQQIKPDVLCVGAKHWDRRLFDELVPLPQGTSYNSYLIKGSEKTALIDTVEPEVKDQLFRNLARAGVSRIDYIISNHAEQDHSGSIPMVLEKFPEAKVVTNPKCKTMLQDLLPLEDKVFIIKDDEEELSLGNKTLKFLLTPWVHWPETMSTYLIEDKILFPCDFFGSHIAASKLFVQDEGLVLEAAKRYYAEIMMPFRMKIRNNMEKLSAYPIDYIAPSHGQVYDKPELIWNAYKDWVSQEVKNEVVLPFVSMHGSTRKMVDYLIDALTDRGISVKPFNLTVSDLGEIAMALVDAATVILAAPTVLNGAHPEALYSAALINALRPKTKYMGIIGSFGWGGLMEKQIGSLLNKMKVEYFPPVLIMGDPKEKDFEALNELADAIELKHSEL